MPYKQKLKDARPKSRRKAVYKVTNWTEYNKSLKRRGELSLYFPTGDIKSQFINEEHYLAGISALYQFYSTPNSNYPKSIQHIARK